MKGGIFEDESSQRLRARVEKLAPLDEIVLILGETGTGKEVVSELLHELSGRKGRRLAVNCGAIAPTLLESELFGYRRGAFTGALEDRRGYFAEARDGTLFLDEIGELPLDLQAKLLRVIRERTYLPVGSTREEKADSVRLIAATNRDLVADCKAGRFREDLYHRIHQFQIEVLPLRQRPADARALAQAQALLTGLGEPFVAEVVLSVDDLSRLPNAWRGNVTELKRFVTCAAVEGVAAERQRVVAEWNRWQQATPAPSVPSADVTSQERLAGLLRQSLRVTPGRSRKGAHVETAMLLAERLLAQGAHGVPDHELKTILQTSNASTVKQNVDPLVARGLVRRLGAGIGLVWPPVATRWFHRRGEEQRLLRAGDCPDARAGDEIWIELTPATDMELELRMVTHRPSTAPRLTDLVQGKLVSGGQPTTCKVELDDEPGLEQLLARLAFPASRGGRLSPIDAAQVVAQHQLERAKEEFQQQRGGGWIEELLVNHLR